MWCEVSNLKIMNFNIIIGREVDDNGKMQVTAQDRRSRQPCQHPGRATFPASMPGVQCPTADLGNHVHGRTGMRRRRKGNGMGVAYPGMYLQLDQLAAIGFLFSDMATGMLVTWAYIAFFSTTYWGHSLGDSVPGPVGTHLEVEDQKPGEGVCAYLTAPLLGRLPGWWRPGGI